MTAGQPEQWREELCGCANDPSSCCLSLWCPAIQYAYNSRVIDQAPFCGACCEYILFGMIGCDVCVRGALRRRLRRAYGMSEPECCCDCFTHFACGCCALAQETREIAARGAPQRMVMMAVHQSPMHVTVVNAASPAMMVQATPVQLSQSVQHYQQTSPGQPHSPQPYAYTQQPQQQQHQQQWQQQQQTQYHQQQQQQQQQYPTYVPQPSYPPPPEYQSSEFEPPQKPQPSPDRSYPSLAAPLPVASQPVIYTYNEPSNDSNNNGGSATGNGGEGHNS